MVKKLPDISNSKKGFPINQLYEFVTQTANLHCSFMERSIFLRALATELV